MTKNITKRFYCPNCGTLTIAVVLSITGDIIEFECQKCHQISNLPKKVCHYELGE